MTLRRQKSIAWITLAAVLFSGFSPAFAGALFPDRPDMLGRMLQIPPPSAHAAPQTAAIEGDDGCPHETASGGHHEPAHPGHNGNTGQESDKDPDHAAHGAFCSFCLTASSVVTLLSAGPTPLAQPASSEPISGPELRPARFAPSRYRARGPPIFPC